MIIPLLIVCSIFCISEAIKEKNKLSLFGYICYLLAEFIDAFSLFNIEYKFGIVVTIVFLELLGTILLLIDFII